MNNPLATHASRANLLYTVEEATPPPRLPRRDDLACSSKIRRLTQTFGIVLRRREARTVNKGKPTTV